MPILAVLTGIASTVLALLLDGGSERAIVWSGMGLVVLVTIASVAIGEPINSKFRRLLEGQVPERAEHYRDLGRNFTRRGPSLHWHRSTQLGEPSGPPA